MVSMWVGTIENSSETQMILVGSGLANTQDRHGCLRMSPSMRLSFLIIWFLVDFELICLQ